MSYQVLARKWRPKSFDTLKGQWHVVRALMNAIGRGQYHHAYLFTGTRGVGKTSLARILAKAFNCEQGVTSSPCGQCANCLAIDAGRFVDLLEIDAASRTRVEDTRELLDNVQYAPQVGRYKIYLIDEVHMLSGHSFNALLKTLEEPPSHVIFVLATTDPERIPITVLSRCLRFNLRPLPENEIVEQLKEILNQENISFEMGALEKLARMAQGSMRDALSLLEQAIAYSDETLQLKDVEEMLGVAYERSIPSMITALISKNIAEALKITSDMAENGADFEQVCSSLQRAFYALAIAQSIETEDEVLGSLTNIDSAILSLKFSISPEELQLLYQIASMGKKDLRYAPDERTGFEMMLLRMVAFRPHSMGVAPTMSASIPEPTLVATSSPVPKPSPIAKPKPKEEVKVINSNDPLNWAQLVMQLPLSGLSAVLVKHCVVSSWDGERLALTLDVAHKACLNDTRHLQIQEAISQHLGRPIKVQITPGEAGETPSMQAKRASEAKVEQAVQSIQQDDVVKNILSTFDAKIGKITVVENERE